MLRNVANRTNAGSLEPCVCVQSTTDRPSGDGLLLFVKQRDQSPFVADIAPDRAVGMIEETNDELLLALWRSNDGNPQKLFRVEAQP